MFKQRDKQQIDLDTNECCYHVKQPDLWNESNKSLRKEKNHKIVSKTIIKKTPKTSIVEEDDEEEQKNKTLNPIKDENEMEIMLKLLDTMESDEIWINYKTNIVMELAIKENKKRKTNR